jgi:hypothetical protein
MSTSKFTQPTTAGPARGRRTGAGARRAHGPDGHAPEKIAPGKGHGPKSRPCRCRGARKPTSTTCAVGCSLARPSPHPFRSRRHRAAPTRRRSSAADMAPPPRATTVLAWCAPPPSLPLILSLARAAGGTQLVATRPPLISLWLVLAAGGLGRTGSWAWAGARRRTGPTAWRRWSPTTSPPSSPAAATPSPSATTDACVPPPPFPAAGLLRPLAREPLCSEFSF